MIPIIIFDLDDTLVSPKMKIPQQNLSYVKQI